MRIKSLRLIGLIAVAAAAVHGQSTNQPVYWSATQPDCSKLHESPVMIATSATGGVVGYSCYVIGTFVWLAAGGMWSSAIRVAAPASAAIGVEYTFYDTNGRSLSLDTTGSLKASTNDVGFALYPNQPTEIDLLGATSDAPGYPTTATGSVTAAFFCPDAVTCSNVLPQLIYSALPTYPWSLSVPIAWDDLLSAHWSAEGIEDGHTRRVSLVIYNADQTATSYTIRVYDSTGTLAGTGTTPSIPGAPTLPDGSIGQGGTQGALLSDLISKPLPPDIYKIFVDGGTSLCAVEMLQVHGLAATTLQVAYDTAPAATSALQRSSVRRSRVESTPKPMFTELPNTKTKNR